MRTFLVLLLLSLPAAAKELHPPVLLLDQEGKNVLSTGAPVSTLRTCGICHDTRYIASHSYHAWYGEGGWDPMISPGPAEAGSAPWIKRNGFRHTGGGHAAPLGVEPNCFLCHMEDPDNRARIDCLEKGSYPWAATATLASTELVMAEGEGFVYNRKKFISTGGVRKANLKLRHPGVKHCGICHGQVHDGPDPLVLKHGVDAWSTETTGQIFSWQQMSLSGVNLHRREEMSRAWDVHAERLLDCANCHPSLNNPGYYAESSVTRPKHQRFEARKLKMSQYLKQPSHHFAKGYSVQGRSVPGLDGTMRRCEDCHDFDTTHDWLPYGRQHLRRLLCEACHIPKLFAPARAVTDWTVITPDEEPRIRHRGADGPLGRPETLVKGYRPVLLKRSMDERLGPMNLITTWYWRSGDTGLPVGIDALGHALFEGNGFHPDILAALDSDGNGKLSPEERVLDTKEKVHTLSKRLEAAGVPSPVIGAEVRPYGIHHGVAALGWATRDCRDCHSRRSILAAPFEIAGHIPGSIVPDLPFSGEMETTEEGGLVFTPHTERAGLYVIGHDRSGALDLVGLLALLATLAGAGIHGGLRFLRHRRRIRGGTA